MRFLDYTKVKEAERERGRELFGTDEEPTALASEVRTCLFFFLFAWFCDWLDPGMELTQDTELDYGQKVAGGAQFDEWLSIEVKVV